MTTKVRLKDDEQLFLIGLDRLPRHTPATRTTVGAEVGRDDPFELGCPLERLMGKDLVTVDTDDWREQHNPHTELPLLLTPLGRRVVDKLT